MLPELLRPLPVISLQNLTYWFVLISPSIRSTCANLSIVYCPIMGRFKVIVGWRRSLAPCCIRDCGISIAILPPGPLPSDSSAGLFPVLCRCWEPPSVA